MKKVACIALVGALGLFGCGGGGSDDDDDDIVFPDADTNPDDPDAAPSGECNPVSQTGCADGQKCAFIVDQLDPIIGHIGCTADGVDAVGGACTEAAVVNTADSCLAGGECYNGFCHEICTTVNDQCVDGTCQVFVDGNGNPLPTEICLFSCDPLLQNCLADNEGCFIARDAVCVVAGTATVGQPCQFANGCIKNHICIGDPGVCRTFCGPVLDAWTEVDKVLETPNCCGTNCTISNPCALPTDVCWVIGDGMGGIAHETAGFCISDTDISGDTLACDCDNAPTVCAAIE